MQTDTSTLDPAAVGAVVQQILGDVASSVGLIAPIVRQEAGLIDSLAGSRPTAPAGLAAGKLLQHALLADVDLLVERYRLGEPAAHGPHGYAPRSCPKVTRSTDCAGTTAACSSASA